MNNMTNIRIASDLFAKLSDDRIFSEDIWGADTLTSLKSFFGGDANAFNPDWSDDIDKFLDQFHQIEGQLTETIGQFKVGQIGGKRFATFTDAGAVILLADTSVPFMS